MQVDVTERVLWRGFTRRYRPVRRGRLQRVTQRRLRQGVAALDSPGGQERLPAPA